MLVLTAPAAKMADTANTTARSCLAFIVPLRISNGCGHKKEKCFPNAPIQR